jgi:hypothetical protein
MLLRKAAFGHRLGQLSGIGQAEQQSGIGQAEQLSGIGQAEQLSGIGFQASARRPPIADR